MSIEKLPVTELKGVGDRLAEVLAKLNITNIQDLVFHLPYRYLDRTRIVPIANLALNSNVMLQGRVLNTQIAFGKRRSLVVKLEDETGVVTLRFYHFSAAQKNNLQEGTLLRCYGEPRLGASGLELYHPEYEIIRSGQTSKHTENLTPVYSLTDGISQQRLRKLTEAAIQYLKRFAPEELLPTSVNEHFNVESLSAALAYLHFPPPDANIDALLEGSHPYQKRLAFEELLAHFLVRQKLRAEAQQHHGPVITASLTNNRNSPLLDEFLNQLPFKPTSAQQRVLSEIQKDLALGVPMLRMVQGDVGSGKTLVAAMAALLAISSGYQVALVAPTEILAEQHFANFCQWFAPLGLDVTRLMGKLTAKQKREALERIANHQTHIIVGTHALFQDGVVIPKLGLAVIDEQHRFGVEQRLTLRKPTEDGETPHQLVMTATPIPRTLAMTAYADLDYSIIDELPPGRTPISTALISQNRREEIIARIAIACGEGKQVYWVCPLVEESETLSAANAEETSAALAESLQGIKVGLVHGRMKAAEKESIMSAFANAETQVLVATTVIEVGVDVPNASLMIIENPERLGLAQLHQLRGRVGRGTQASYCILLYGDKLSEQAKERLKVLRETNDGFKIAERDLQLRGPGELLGTRQTGDMSYRLADACRDAAMIPMVHKVGRELMNSHPQSAQALINRWFSHTQSYAQV